MEHRKFIWSSKREGSECGADAGRAWDGTEVGASSFLTASISQ